MGHPVCIYGFWSKTTHNPSILDHTKLCVIKLKQTTFSPASAVRVCAYKSICNPSKQALRQGMDCMHWHCTFFVLLFQTAASENRRGWRKTLVIFVTDWRVTWNWASGLNPISSDREARSEHNRNDYQQQKRSSLTEAIKINAFKGKRKNRTFFSLLSTKFKFLLSERNTENWFPTFCRYPLPFPDPVKHWPTASLTWPVPTVRISSYRESRVRGVLWPHCHCCSSHPLTSRVWDASCSLRVPLSIICCSLELT